MAKKTQADVEADRKRKDAEKWEGLIVRHPRWAKLTDEQLKGADYALRVLHSSTQVRGEPLALLESLIGQVRAEMGR